LVNRSHVDSEEDQGMPPPVVAVINTSPATVEFPSSANPAGFVVVSAYTHEIRTGGFALDAFSGRTGARPIR
jgi:hypothetical protein